MQAVLFELYFSAYLFEGLLQVLGVGLGETFLNNAGCAVNEFLSFLQTETCEFLNSLYDLELSCACALEDYVEAGFLLSGGCAGCGTCCYSYSGCCGFDAILFLEDGGEFVYFLYGKVN